MAAGQIVDGIDGSAGEAIRIARIDHLLRPTVEIGEHVLFGPHDRTFGAGFVNDLFRRKRTAFDGAILRVPFRPPSVEDRRAIMAEQAEHEPGARGAPDRRIVV